MKKYNVTISLIRGYYNDEDKTPNCEIKQFEVQADTEEEAITKAKELENSHYSIEEIYADEIDD